MVRYMTNHFCQRWKERIGGVPSIAGLNRMVAAGVPVRKQKTFYQRHFGLIRRVKLLAEIWNREVDIIIRMDQDSGTAVTVFRPKRVKSGG